MTEASATNSGSSSDGLFPESRPDIPTDDWDDQDLLTKDEARLRLEQSAAVLRSDLAKAEQSNPSAVADLELQIKRIEIALSNISQRSKF
ncbi:hypothetical protein ACSMXN_14295 [Jatrophihabitans sp. DSM 45814]